MKRSLPWDLACYKARSAAVIKDPTDSWAVGTRLTIPTLIVTQGLTNEREWGILSALSPRRMRSATSKALDTQGQFRRSSLFEVLIWAASRHDSIEHTSELLEGVPSGNGMRYHLGKLQDLRSLEAQLNRALHSKLNHQSGSTVGD